MQFVNKSTDTPSRDAIDMGNNSKKALPITQTSTPRTMGALLFMSFAGKGGLSKRITSSDDLNRSIELSDPRIKRVSLAFNLMSFSSVITFLPFRWMARIVKLYLDRK